MRNLISVLVLVAIYGNIFAQSELIFKAVDNQSSTGIPYAYAYNLSTGNGSVSNENGQFRIAGSSNDSIQVSSLGYSSQIGTFDELNRLKIIRLSENASLLETISIEADVKSDLGAQKLDKINLKLLPVNNAQDLLKTINGVFIAQHAGGGKAEQIFLRGFDNDHGTDFGVFIDDIPINLSNHAHGQGYADMHFIIPELIQDADYYKGPFEVQNGNFVVSGAARYKTANGLHRNTLKFDLGQYGLQRGLIMLNLTPNDQLFTKSSYEKAYFAIEGTSNQGFFESSQKFRKINSFLKYNTQLGKNTALSVSGSYFTSQWDASGQIPLRAVNNGTIGWFGAIDDTEGGATARTNIGIKLSSFLPKDQKISHFGYYSNNTYQLFSNFTFFMNDPVNGDMVEQNERRNLFGYTFEYNKNHQFRSSKLSSTLSAGFRSDLVHSELLSAVKRETLETLDNNTIQEVNAWAYFRENWQLNSKWTFQIGGRFDFFSFAIQDQLKENGNDRSAFRLSPKASVFFSPTRNIQLFFKAGSGFHSNYAHAAVGDRSIHPLPRAYASDLGADFKIGEKLITSTSIWVIRSDAEYIFVADAGEFENNGASIRYGFDFASKYEVIKNLWFDLALNYSIGKLLEEPESANSIPAAPRLTSTSSLIYKSTFGLDLMLATRYMARRPLTEDESVFADAYFLMDGSINYSFKNLQLGFSAQNLLNQQWMEAVFYDSSQLSTETSPIDDFHFTPGTPFFLKASISYSF